VEDLKLERRVERVERDGRCGGGGGMIRLEGKKRRSRSEDV
jgi:hypothetical protein